MRKINENDKAKLRIPIMFQRVNTYQVEDTRFIPVKIFLMHTNENYNGSIFTKEVVEAAIPSLANTPILAFVEMNSEGETDFSDHRYIIEKKDGEYTDKYIGNSIGVIPETNNARFEHRLCDDGLEREFLVVDGLVWTKWDDPVDIFNRDIIKNNSMEIDENYYEGFEDNNGYFNFTKFRFFGACALGIDYQPAMHNSTIEANFSIDGFKAEVQAKMEQFKLFMSQNQSDNSVDINKNFSIQEGGNEELNVGQINAILKEFSLQLSDIDFEIKDDVTEDDFKNLLTEFVEKQKVSTTYSSTYKQKREALSNACDSVVVKDNEGNVVSETWYYVCDFDDKYVFVEKYVWTSNDSENTYGRFEYSFNEEDKTATVTSEFEQMILQWLTMDENAKLEASRGTFEALQNEFEQYKKDYSTSNVEVDKLTEFKNQKLNDEREVAEINLFSQFDETLCENEEYKAIKEKSKDFTLEDIEKQCLILFGKENMKLKSYTVVSSKQKSTKIPTTDVEDVIVSPYGNLFDN